MIGNPNFHHDSEYLPYEKHLSLSYFLLLFFQGHKYDIYALILLNIIQYLLHQWCKKSRNQKHNLFFLDEFISPLAFAYNKEA